MKISQISQENIYVGVFFNKVAGLLQLYYKRLQHRCFPVKFVKFLRTPFFAEHRRWLLLQNLFGSSRERRLHITGEIYMQLSDRRYLFCWLRMSPAVFEELQCLVASHISIKVTKLRQPISPSQRLRYFAITCYWR